MIRAFEDQRPFRPEQLPCYVKAFGVARAFNHYVCPRWETVLSHTDRYAPSGQDLEFLRVASDDQELTTGQSQDLGHEEAKLAITQDHYLVHWPQVHLGRDAAGRSERFHEYGRPMGYLFWDRVQILPSVP
jgi:hypothetical protein